MRSRQGFDAVQGQYVYVFDVVPPGAAAPTDAQIRARLDSLGFTPDAGCDERYAAVLREKVGDAELADAFRPSGELTDLYRREAMLRLGRSAEGTVKTDTGETLHTGSSLELALALQSAARVKGYLALLGALARSEPQPADALRTLVAPTRTSARLRADLRLRRSCAQGLPPLARARHSFAAPHPRDRDMAAVNRRARAARAGRASEASEGHPSEACKRSEAERAASRRRA